MELYVGVIGIVGVVFVVIFGGRGLIDLVRGYSERRRTRLAAADDSPAAEQPVGAIAATTIAQESLEPTEPTPAVPLVELDPVYRRTFVGRDAELKQLHDAFDEALAGHGSLAMVVGEPGIGKTSMCEQLAGYVAEKGGKTLVGHCYEEGSLSLPYLAFVEAVRSHVLVLEPQDLKAQLGQGADELARIVPEIRERMQIELSPPGDAEEERYRLLQAASDFLRNAAAVQPLVVVLEDLHDADRGTLDMLTHLARNLSGSRLLVVGTYRDVQVDRAHPLSSALAELRRVTSFERIQLRGLTQDEVHRMLGAIAGHEVPWRWAEVVYRQTEGNPLFVQEVMRYLVEEGLLARQEGELRTVGDEPLAGRIPEGLRDVIGKRMTRLSAQCNQVLSVAAVIGREFGPEVLQLVAGIAEEELFGVLEEARDVAVLEERTGVGAAVSYRFAHAFFRQTLYEEMIAPRRIRLHQQVAHALEDAYATRLEEHAAELAEHYAHSSDPADLTKAVTYGEVAARRAMDVFAYGEAARLLQQAIQVQEVLDPEDKAKRCDLLLAFGGALLPSGEPQRFAETIAPQTFGLAEELGDQARASATCRMALIALERYSGILSQGTDEYRQWAERADRWAPAGSVDRVYAEAALFFVRSRANDTEPARDYLGKVLELGRKIGTPEVLFLGGRLAVQPEGGLTEQEQYQVARDLLECGRQGVDLFTLTRTLYGASGILFGQADRDGTEALWRELEEMGTRTRDTYVMLRGPFIASVRAMVDGRLEEAVAAAQDLRRLADELGSADFGYRWSPLLSLRPLLDMGHGEEALKLLADTPRTPFAADISGDLAPRTLCLAHLGREADCRGAIEDATQSDATNTAVIFTFLEAAVLIGHVDGAASLAEKLTPSVSPGFLRSPEQIGTSAGRLFSAAAAMQGKLDEAVDDCRQAIAACEKARFRPELALCRLQLAELLLDHYPDERADALGHLDFAIGELREMKMQPSLEKAEALRAAQTN